MLNIKTEPGGGGMLSRFIQRLILDLNIYFFYYVPLLHDI